MIDYIEKTTTLGNKKIKCPSCHKKQSIKLDKDGNGTCKICQSGYIDMFHSNKAKKKASFVIGTIKGKQK